MTKPYTIGMYRLANTNMQWRSKVPKSRGGWGGGAHRHVMYVPLVKNQYRRVVIGYSVIY